MKICLRYLGDPGYQQGIGQELDMEAKRIDEYINRKGKPTLNVQATCDL
ncbi:unnamed protein product [Acanthoscelides obtectus]|uniref:Uncharacterized protein n=1 Tax=Acanthoscelides obtectus TaxID=200917 RepID=A0A9P0M993_ACAOB|nr:unnamed protein product [Acanthoscelides obtectus]CAK1660708.1 hypothetical protein AOBTE_LOCUS22229 [Acanthoscelides obtectus]